jgi:hypothetical protein
VLGGLGDGGSGAEKLALVGVGVAAVVALVVLAHLAGRRRMARWEVSS